LIPPLVSICTPTKDRLGFLALLRRCIQLQTYPADRIEWVVVDDGLESAEAVCADFPQLRYVRLEGACPLGRKRNLSHQAARGEILLNMDDDDYYPPERVAHAVESLLANPRLLMAGSSELPLYFHDRGEIWHLGPYGPNHATAATFAFRRGLLAITGYDEGAARAEESHFLKGFEIPMVQLEPRRTILALAHPGNTFDKRPLLEDPTRSRARRTDLKLEEVIEAPALREAYLEALSI